MGLPQKKNEVKPAEKPVAKPAAKKGDGEGRGRKSPYAGKRIYLKVKENPYRKGSLREANFKLVKEGMTFEEYVKAGGDPFNLKYGVMQKHFDVR